MVDEKLLERLKLMRLRMPHKSSLNLSGNHKSIQKGISAEFSDFREYMPGDDLRRLDWNAYARLDRLYIREYLEEKEAVVSILIDTSASMDYGDPSKSRLALDIAAIIAFLALENQDRVVLYDMKDMASARSFGGGSRTVPRVLNWLEGLSFGGKTDIKEAARRIQFHGSGVTAIISDFLQEEMADAGSDAYGKLIGYLRYRGQRPLVLHTLAAQELRVGLEGTLNLIDSETGERLRLTADARSIREYTEELSAFIGRLKKGCEGYVLCDAGRSIEQIAFEDLRAVYDI